MVKIATMANKPHDNLRMLRLVSGRVPTVGMCMGDMGTPSRISGRQVRTSLHLRHVQYRAGLRPGQLSFRKCGDLPLRAHRSRHGGVRRHRRPDRAQHEPVDPQHGLRGAGSTRSTCRFAFPARTCSVLWTAAAVGAARAERHNPAQGGGARQAHGRDDTRAGNRGLQHDGRSTAAGPRPNTDCQAAMDSLERALGGWDKAPVALVGKTALMIGAGGAAKAIAYGLNQARGPSVHSAARWIDGGSWPSDRLRLRRLEKLRHSSPRRARQLHAGRHASQRRRIARTQAIYSSRR